MIHLLDLHGTNLKLRDLCDGIEGGIGQPISCTFNEMEGDEDRIPLHPVAEISLDFNLTPSG